MTFTVSSGQTFPIRIKLMPFSIIAVFCGRFGILIDWLNNAYLAFFTFSDNLFAQNLSFNLTSSLLIVLYRTAGYACDIYKVLSSAKENRDISVQYVMSFM